MGALFGGGGSIAVPSIPPAPPSALPATMANPAVAQAGAQQRSAAALAAGSGFSGTIQNSGGAAGLEPPSGSTALRSLLG